MFKIHQTMTIKNLNEGEAMDTIPKSSEEEEIDPDSELESMSAQNVFSLNDIFQFEPKKLADKVFFFLDKPKPKISN